MCFLVAVCFPFLSWFFLHLKPACDSSTTHKSNDIHKNDDAKIFRKISSNQSLKCLCVLLAIQWCFFPFVLVLNPFSSFTLSLLFDSPPSSSFDLHLIRWVLFVLILPLISPPFSSNVIYWFDFSHIHFSPSSLSSLVSTPVVPVVFFPLSIFPLHKDILFILSISLLPYAH